MTGAIVIVVVLIAAVAFGLYRKFKDGRFSAHKSDAAVLTEEQLGGELGPKATLVEFSSAFCAPCRATRQILDRVVGDVEGVALIEIDAEQNLDLVRELNIMRTPTVLVLDANGAIAHRASGLPTYPAVVAALAQAIPA